MVSDVKKALFVISSVLLLSSLAPAQAPAPIMDEPEYAEVSAAFSHASGPDIGMWGWHIGGALRPNHWLGLVADFSGHYGSDELLLLDIDNNLHNFLFGPRLYFRLEEQERLRPFGHILFGASRLHTESESAGVDFTETAFSWALGGGIDYALTERVAARGQIELLRTSFGDGGQNNRRISIGLVYRFLD